MSGLEQFRERLDHVDEQITRLLGERFEICREVAHYKREHDVPMMQPERVSKVRARYLARGAEVNLPAEFIAREGMGVAYAFAPERGHLVARFARPEPGFHEWARTGELVESIPAWGASQRRVVTMTQARQMATEWTKRLGVRAIDAGARVIEA